MFNCNFHLQYILITKINVNNQGSLIKKSFKLYDTTII